jgi:D-glycero-alpha-D-manno-heptose 1-phosphate guanylyltransferase
MKFHKSANASATLALKEMNNFDRYGIVETGNNGVITAFREKQFREWGLINGGVYLLNRERFLAKNLPEKFSFEKDYLERFVSENQYYGYKSDGYFIDIGIPEDFSRAQEDFKSIKL